MKKLFVLLLALAVVTGAFAQVTTAISLSGGVKLIDQDNMSAFEQDGDGYDVLTFKATDKDGTYGFSMTDSEILGGGITLRDWTVWYKIFDGKVKFSAGKLRNADYRTILPNWYTDTFGGTDRISGQAFLLQFMPMDGLSIGLSHPVATSDQDFADVTLKGADIGLAYTIADVGKATFLVRMNEAYSIDLNGDDDTLDAGEAVTDALMVNAGFSFTGMEGLTANVLGKFVSTETGDASHIFFAAGADYAVTDALTAMLEFGLASKPEFSGNDTAATLGTFWDIWARGKYQISDMLYAYATFKFNQDSEFSVIATPGVDFGNGFNVELDVGYDSVADLVYDVYLYYAVAF